MCIKMSRPLLSVAFKVNYDHCKQFSNCVNHAAAATAKKWSMAVLLIETSVFAVSENKTLCHPASVDSLSTSAGTEDHVSMGGFAARKALRVVRNVEKVICHRCNIYWAHNRDVRNCIF